MKELLSKVNNDSLTILCLTAITSVALITGEVEVALAFGSGLTGYAGATLKK